ncbi:uncharacterized protein HD556DRAFT_1314805 [Suillus plorans]|uniref:DUF6532 domain-containing protein n=1 Tax=Suillus plorans TaxID=116603 RepID=A0A9P7DAA0_9AGAM|nr:uncharacterized protein HD556DRAFT_1314805 [Suillus plorans]KAG1784787.1 hypothetical protein HD556DRAFT_1314805 [Suillus plorans]
MSAPLNSREPRNAKKKAMENAGKVPRPKTDPPVPKEAAATRTGTTRSDSSVKNLVSSKLKHQRTFADDLEEDSGDESDGGSADLQPDKPRANYRPSKLCRTYAMRDVSALLDSDDDQPEEDITNGNDSDADCEESEGEEPETTAMMLSDEVPSLVSNINVNLKSKQVIQSRGKSQSARDAKQAAEIPTWRDCDNAVSESVDETTTACGESSEPYSSDVEPATRTRSAQTIASLIRTEKGHVKLLDQNNETQGVVRNAIIDAKGYIIFVDAYPELVDKNQVSLQSLLTVAGNRGVHAIKERLQTDARYAAHLASLVEPRIPLLRRDLKVAACANIDSYFRLGNNLVKAKKLMEQHAYIYALRFDLNHDASPIGKKPYQGELLIFLIYEGVFSGAKSIGVKFAERFAELANNKGNRPEIPIPLLALVATAVYAALFWKTLGSPGKFNFTGNQFSETYVFHVRFLEDLKRDAPGKFHCMMADIYEAVQTLKQNGNEHFADEHRDALGLLDLDGMAED